MLYAALLVLLATALVSDGSGPIPALHTAIGVLPRWQTVAILSVLAVISLRDKIIFLAARAEVYAPLALVFLFAGADIVVGAKVVFMVIWIGAATSKLNRHFPFVISTMLANNPFIPSGPLKRSMFKHYPDDLRPSGLAGFIAHFSTAVEGLVPLVLFFSHGGWPTAIAAFVMIVFHLNILLAFPMGVPLELERLHDLRGAVAVRRACAAGAVECHQPGARGRAVRGHRRDRRHSGTCSRARCPSCPACATTPATGTPRCGASSRRSTRSSAPARAHSARCSTCSSSGCTRPKRKPWFPLHLAFAFRGMNTHGRALFTLVHRALAGYDEDDYNLCEGETLCAMVLGWNFGDGHLHNECLIEALQERCGFEPGDVRVVILDAQPIQNSAKSTGWSTRRRANSSAATSTSTTWSPLSRGPMTFRCMSRAAPAPVSSAIPDAAHRDTTTTAPTPASDAITAGFLTNSITLTLRSSARRRGLARTASESTVDASWSRATSMSRLMVSGSRSATCLSSKSAQSASKSASNYPRSACACPDRSGERKGSPLTETKRLAAGDKAPAFSLPDADGNKVSLADYKGRRVVVYFYPAASTPGCTKQACDFRDSLAELNGAGLDVVGISPDKPEKLAKFRDAQGLTFPLLSDPDRTVLTA